MMGPAGALQPLDLIEKEMSVAMALKVVTKIAAIGRAILAEMMGR